MSKPLLSIDFVAPTFAELIVMTHEFVLEINCLLLALFLFSNALRLIAFESVEHLT